jgi:hypothetical protein
MESIMFKQGDYVVQTEKCVGFPSFNLKEDRIYIVNKDYGLVMYLTDSVTGEKLKTGYNPFRFEKVSTLKDDRFLEGELLCYHSEPPTEKFFTKGKSYVVHRVTDKGVYVKDNEDTDHFLSHKFINTQFIRESRTCIPSQAEDAYRAFDRFLSRVETARQDQNSKDTNPKDAIGTAKVPMSTVSAVVLAELGVGMAEGGLKYGRHNYRVAGVRASVYYDAAMRHLMAWFEGEDIDPDSGMSHISKAMASCAVLRDAMVRGKMIDDRPPKTEDGWMNPLHDKMKELLEKYPDPKPAYTEENTKDG